MTPIGLTAVRLSPSEAAMRGQLGAPPQRASLLSIAGRPAYRFGGGRDATIVFADTGDVADEFTDAQTRQIAASFMRVPLDRVEFIGTIEGADQWTLGIGRVFPLHKFNVHDAEGSEVYVSPATGEPIMLTTTKTRLFAWISTIPHWLYFEGLRSNQLLWNRVVVWTSAIVTALAVLGVVLGVTQYRRGRATFSAAIPYAGWMRWHYITGLIFGVCAVTWAFSGLLSMEPFAWTNARGIEPADDALTGGDLDLAAYKPMEPAAWNRLLDGGSLKQVDFVRMQGEHYYVVRRTTRDGQDLGKRERLHQPYPVRGRVAADRLIVSAATLEPRTTPFTADQIVQRVRAAVPDTPIVDYSWLTEYDSYYYSRTKQTPLPVVRIRFADPAATWLYVDPTMNEMLASIPRLGRLERWLYNGLHSLDVGYLSTRPLWDIVMLLLLVGGLSTSVIGMYVGVKRAIRALVRMMPKTNDANRDLVGADR